MTKNKKSKLVMNFGTLTVLASASIYASTTYAATFAESCPDIPTCAKVVGELLGQKYVFDEDVKGRVFATPNLEITKENAEIVFTNMLRQQNYARVPLGIPNGYQIARQRDARDMAIPLVKATQSQAPNLPPTWDLMTLSYKATNPEVVEDIARSARSFMPANSRIIPYAASGTLLITDEAPNLKKLYALIVEMDQKPTAAMKKRWEERDRAHLREGLKAFYRDQNKQEIQDNLETLSAPPRSSPVQAKPK